MYNLIHIFYVYFLIRFIAGDDEKKRRTSPRKSKPTQNDEELNTNDESSPKPNDAYPESVFTPPKIVPPNTSNDDASIMPNDAYPDSVTTPLNVVLPNPNYVHQAPKTRWDPKLEKDDIKMLSVPIINVVRPGEKTPVPLRQLPTNFKCFEERKGPNYKMSNAMAGNTKASQLICDKYPFFYYHINRTRPMNSKFFSFNIFVVS